MIVLNMLSNSGPFLASFHDTIKGAVSEIIEWLNGNNSIVRAAGANAMGTLADKRK